MAKHRTHHLVDKLAPSHWAAAMEAESREWMVRCGRCGFEQSIWDLGGVRWKGRGTSWTVGRCPGCRKLAWFKVYRRAPTTTEDHQGASSLADQTRS